MVLFYERTDFLAKSSDPNAFKSEWNSSLLKMRFRRENISE